MTNWIVPLADLTYDAQEDNAVLEVLHSKWLTMGEVTQSFESEFAAFTGAKHAFALSNATQALHLACTALGLGPGDEVITPSLTFVATNNAVLYTGATPVFADVIGPQDLTLDPADIERKITPRTRAIIVMHYAGFPCRMPEILAIARAHGLALIEDAAHAPGAYLDGQHLGAWGDLGCFSFFSNKNLSTGEGGMLITNRDDLADKVRLQRSHGMTTLTYDRHKGHAYTYDVVDLGYNDRIDEIRAALGRVQLAKLPANNALRRELTLKYWQLLDGVVDLPFRDSLAPRSGERVGVRGPVVESLQTETSGSSISNQQSTIYNPSHHLLPIILPTGVNRIQIIDSLREKGIQTSIHYPPTHTFTYYKNRFGDPSSSLPITTDLAARELTLPLYPTMGMDSVSLVCSELIKALPQSPQR
ncbi:MAG: DegT/DnrJ/EryC1/StrS family aminotransferase [Anaerolineaceae bacterium]|nr:DegT/DnrJ/EryC1/StrS family aminotransferase [Anaerolineaceae bacterium]